MTEIVETHLTGMWLIAEAVSDVLQTASGRLIRPRKGDRMAPAAPTTSGPVPRTVFNAPLTKRREVGFASISVADAKTVSDAFGGSITNVVLAACTLSLRAWLQQHGRVPDDPLLMRMPLELPTTDPRRNRKALSVGRLRIPVHLDDPVQVLANLHTAAERLNATPDDGGESKWTTTDLVGLASLLPLTIARLGMKFYARSGLQRRLTPVGHGTVSYTAGDRAPA